jgi:hypothetical protein
VFSQKIDAYIAKAAPFARPILAHIRAVVHAAAPGIVEEIKWSSPFFTQDGQIVCSMSAFKAHCGLFFWKGALVVPEKESVAGSMGQFGKLTSVDQLPSDEVLAGYVRKALQLNEDRVPAPHVEKRRLQKTSAEKSRGAAPGGKRAGGQPSAAKETPARKPTPKK